MDEVPSYLVRDRDGTYGRQISRQVKVLGIQEVVTAPRSPWQNGYAERVIGSIRRDCLDHVIVLGEGQLKRVLSEYTDYYNRVRTHLSLEKDAPETRASQTPEQGRVIKFPRVGGLHHEYSRMAA
jgi:transposase InsO family protein